MGAQSLRHTPLSPPPPPATFNSHSSSCAALQNSDRCACPSTFPYPFIKSDKETLPLANIPPPPPPRARMLLTPDAALPLLPLPQIVLDVSQASKPTQASPSLSLPTQASPSLSLHLSHSSLLRAFPTANHLPTANHRLPSGPLVVTWLLSALDLEIGARRFTQRPGLRAAPPSPSSGPSAPW